jgi:hypothetical protein
LEGKDAQKLEKETNQMSSEDLLKVHGSEGNIVLYA